MNNKPNPLTNFTFIAFLVLKKVRIFFKIKATLETDFLRSFQFQTSEIQMQITTGP